MNANANANANVNEEVALRATTYDGRGAVQWLSETKQPIEAPADPTLVDREIYLSPPIRQGNRYPKQRNYHGLYWFSQTATHVPTESRLEAHSLAWLDLTHDIAAIASQPMLITFADGVKHFPDFIALHANHRQVVYDVKPSSLIRPKELVQFARTRALCDRVGWGYQVITELPLNLQRNVAWLSNFKFHAFHPGMEALRRLNDALTAPLGFDKAAEALHLPSMAAARSSLLHLLWVREVTADLTASLNSTTPVGRNTNANL